MKRFARINCRHPSISRHSSLHFLERHCPKSLGLHSKTCESSRKASDVKSMEFWSFALGYVDMWTMKRKIWTFLYHKTIINIFFFLFCTRTASDWIAWVIRHQFDEYVIDKAAMGCACVWLIIGSCFKDVTKIKRLRAKIKLLVLILFKT